MVSFALLAVIISLLPLALTQTCYLPDGTESSDIPCLGDGQTSHCCGSDSWCIDNGLCYQYGSVSRQSCTDRNWGDDCPQYCINSTSGGAGGTSCDSSIGCTVMTCDGFYHIFTCGFADNCADDDLTFELPMGPSNAFILKPQQAQLLQLGTDAVTLEPTPTNVATRDGVSVVTVTSTVTGKARATGVASSETDGGGNSGGGYTSGQMAGVGAGVGVPLLLALVAAIFVIFRQKKRVGIDSAGGKTVEQTYAYQHSGAPATNGYHEQELADGYDMSGPQRQELSAVVKRSTMELDGRRINEMSAK